MMSSDWQRTRSDFNHGWLKNRLLVALLKSMRVASGQVEDRNAGEAMTTLIAEWGVMRGTARSLLDFLDRRTSAPMSPTPQDVAIFGEELANFLLEVERQRWLIHSDARKRAADARREIESLDRALSALAPCLHKPLGPLRHLLDDCMHAGRRLTERFSHLTIPRDFILC